jgi:glycosyltransferase involved in cell wall biosynthesis
VPSVVHLVVTATFAGVERYVADTARETRARGWDTAVVGGDPVRMRRALGGDVRWRPGATAAAALRSLAGLGRCDVCHAHMTVAEAVALAARPLHRGAVVSTRHFARPRGSTRPGHLLAPWIGARLSRQIAVSEFVARRLERPPDAVVRNGVPPSPLLWSTENRVLLVLQRLEPEKKTETALRAWQASGLAAHGWSLRVVGDGRQRRALQAWTATEALPGVQFAGWRDDVESEFARAGAFLAAAPAEPFGIAVLEAMAAGVPVVASSSGGHLETVGLLPGAPLFPALDAVAAGDALRSLRDDHRRAELSTAGRTLVATSFTVEQHVDALLTEYELALRPRRAQLDTPTEAAVR